MTELEEYQNYMTITRERGDILWQYHELKEEIDHLLRVKAFNHSVIYETIKSKYTQYSTTKMHKEWRTNLVGLLNYLKQLPSKNYFKKLKGKV